MLPDPIDVGLQSIGKAIGARFEPLGLVEENEIEPPQRLGDGVIFHRRHTIVRRVEDRPKPPVGACFETQSVNDRFPPGFHR